MKALRLVPMMMMIPAFAMMGCASSGEDVDTSEGAVGIGAEVSAGAAVGAVIRDGKLLCAATLVDVSAKTSLTLMDRNFSIKGKQIVMGQACVGAMKEGIGASVFVMQRNGISISTPIIAVDAQTHAAAGAMVAILAEQPKENGQPIAPMPMLSAEAAAKVGAKAIVEIDDGQLTVGAQGSASANVALRLRTQKCSDLKVKAGASVAAGAKLSAGAKGLGAGAFVMVNGHLEFALDVDGQCVAHQIKDAAEFALVELPRDVAERLSEPFANIGSGDIPLAVYVVKKGQFNTVTLRFDQDISELRLNALGLVGATIEEKGKGLPLSSDEPHSSCGADIASACKLSFSSGFKKGIEYKVNFRAKDGTFPADPKGDGVRVFLTAKK